MFSQWANKLSAFSFKGITDLCIDAGGDLPPHEQAAALSHALSHLTNLQAPNVRLTVLSATMTPALAACLADAHAAGWQKIALMFVRWPADVPPITTPLPPLYFLGIFQALTDGVLAQLLQCATSVEKVQALALELHAPLAEGTVVPWKLLYVMQSVELGEALQQAALLGSNAHVELGMVTVTLSAEQVSP